MKSLLFPHNTALLLGGLLAALVWVGCDFFEKDGEAAGDLPGGITMMVDADEGATLTTEGGIIATIEPGDLPEDTEVSMVPVAVEDSDGRNIAGVRFEPDGMILDSPIVVSFPLSAGWDATNEPFVLEFKGSDRRRAVNTFAYARVVGSSNNRRAEVLVSHFSGVVCASNCHAGTIQQVLANFEGRGCSQSEALERVRDNFPGVEIPSGGCNINGASNVETVQAFLDTYFIDVGGYDANQPIPSTTLNGIIDAVEDGRQVVVAFKPGTWGQRSGANNFYPTSALEFAHSAPLVVQNGEVQIRNTLAGTDQALRDALGGDNVVYYPARQLNTFRNLQAGVAVELAVCGAPDCLSDPSRNEFGLDNYHPVDGQSYAGRAWSDPWTYLFSQGAWSGIPPRSRPWTAVRIYVERTDATDNPCDPPEGDTFNANIDLPGYTATFDVNFLLAGLGSVDNEPGFPVILVSSDPGGLFTRGDYMQIGFPKNLTDGATYTLSIDGPDEGDPVAFFSTPQIKDEDSGIPTAFASTSGTITLEEAGTQPGERLRGTMIANLEGKQTQIIDGEEEQIPLSGQVTATFDVELRGSGMTMPVQVAIKAGRSMKNQR